MLTTKLRQKLVISGFLLLMALISSIMVFAYVSSEHYFYHWDLAAYQNMASENVSLFLKGPKWATYKVLLSLANDYNELFTLPLIPFILAFGDSRLVYVLAVALLYFLPCALATGGIAAQLIPSRRTAAFWSAALLTLLTPTAWAPILRGYPDAGGAFLIALAILVYVRDTTLGQWWQIPVISFFLTAAMLFRGHFVLAGVVFCASIALQALINFALHIRADPRYALQALLRNGVRIFLTTAITVIFLALLGWPFLYNLLTRDYWSRFASWNVASSFVVFQSYASQYGWAAWVLAGVGLVVGILTRTLGRPVAVFILVFGISSLFQWVFYGHRSGIHYTTHLTSSIVLGLTALGWTAWITLRGRTRALVMTVGAGYLVLNFIVGFAPTDILQNYSIRLLLSAAYPRLVRSDYDEIVRLIAYLRTLAPAKEPIYVVASSGLLSYNLLQNAERSLYGRDRSILNILPIAEIDSLGPFPLEKLLQAQYVLLATPFQFHLRQTETEQDVLKVVFIAFTEKWEIGQDFSPLPIQFTLAEGGVANIYHRKRPTSLETTLRTVKPMKDFIGTLPNHQPDWIMLNYASSSIGKNSDGTHRMYIRTRPDYRNAGSTSSFLYLGVPPQNFTISGTLHFDSDQCSRSTLTLDEIDAQGTQLASTNLPRRPTDPTEFALSSQATGTSYLLLTISRNGQGDHVDSCALKIDHLAVSAS